MRGPHSTQVRGWWGLHGWAPPSRQGLLSRLGWGPHSLPGKCQTPAAHDHCRGARHGLTMSAKLARLEEQEQAFLTTYQHKVWQHEPPESSHPAERQEKKKKKRKQSRDGANPEVLQGQEPSREEEVAGQEGKVVKRKKNQEPSREEEVAGEDGKATKRKKKKKQEEEEEEKEEPVETKKKKKYKEEPAETEVPLKDTDGPDQAGHSPRKRRKKRKKEPE